MNMKVALVCCGRLENRYAIEFVEHYKQLGFDHIYIADNNRENEEHFEDVLQQYIDENFITIYNYRHTTEFIHYVSYIDIYNKISNNYDWVAFYDFDEFLTLVQDANIKDYLSRDCFKDANQILINWKTYTDNNLVYDDGHLCLERFTEPMELYKKAEPNDWCITNEIIKCIIKTKLKDVQLKTNHLFINNLLERTTYNSIGELINIMEYWQPIHYELAYIKHFPTKTIDEWINNKLKRGVGWDLINTQKSYNIERFFKYNEKTPEKLKYLKENNISI